MSQAGTLAKGPGKTPATVRRAVLASAMGNCVEWYDYGVYSYVAGTLGAVFFPTDNKTAQLLSAFGVIALSFLIRPFGGAFFGPLGDKIGRQKVLVTTILLMSGCTVAIGLLPGYATIGLAAPILLTLIRMLQGFSTGGEYGGAATFIAEYSPYKKRGFLGGFLEFGTLAGYSMGAGLAAVLTATMSDGDFTSWGWRIPFLVGGPLGIIGLLLRYKMEDTPAFKELSRSAEVSRTPLRETFAPRNRRNLVICFGIVIGLSVSDYLVLTYMPSYLTDTLDVESGFALLLSVAVMVVMMPLIPLIGALSDRIGRKPVMLAGAAGTIFLSAPAIWLLHQAGTAYILGGMLLMGLCLVCFLGTVPSTLPALFPTAVRYGSFAISYNVGVSLFGGTTPLAVESLTAVTGNSYMPALYVMGAAMIAIVPIIFSPETAGRPLPGAHQPRPPKQQMPPMPPSPSPSRQPRPAQPPPGVEAG